VSGAGERNSGRWALCQTGEPADRCLTESRDLHTQGRPAAAGWSENSEIAVSQPPAKERVCNRLDFASTHKLFKTPTSETQLPVANRILSPLQGRKMLFLCARGLSLCFRPLQIKEKWAGKSYEAF
jgi:hypothetical protein